MIIERVPKLWTASLRREICEEARNNKALNNQGFVGTEYGGGDGIRTHGPVTVDGFQDRCLKPLGHTSVALRAP